MVPSQNGTDLHYVILWKKLKMMGVKHHLFIWGIVKITDFL